MKKIAIIGRVKDVLNEVLTPGSESITVSLSEQPIDTFITNLFDVSIRTFFKDLRPSIVKPYPIAWAKVAENCAGWIQFPSSYDISAITASSFDGQGELKVITIGSTVYDSPGSSWSSFAEGVLYAPDDDGEFVLNADGDTMDTTYGDLFLGINDKYYKVKDSSEVSTGLTTGNTILTFVPSEDEIGYFKNVTLSDEKFIPNITDGNYFDEGVISYAEDFGGMTAEPWVKNSDGALVSYYLPKQFITVRTLLFASWKSKTPKVIHVSDPEYKIQENQYSRSGISKPVVAILKEDDTKYSIEVFSRKDVDDAYKSGTFIQTIPVELIQDDLITCFARLVAFDYLTAIGSPASTQAFELYKKTLSEL